MKKYLCIALTLIYIFFFASCSNEASSNLKQMMSVPVSLPESINIDEDYLFVVYIDSLECATCKLGHYQQYEYVKNTLDDYCDVEMLFIIDADESEKKMIHLMAEAYPQIQFHFVDSTFKAVNPQIPVSTMYHTMLLNSDLYPILVGDPISNTKILSLYINYFK